MTLILVRVKRKVHEEAGKQNIYFFFTLAVIALLRQEEKGETDIAREINPLIMFGDIDFVRVFFFFFLIKHGMVYFLSI